MRRGITGKLIATSALVGALVSCGGDQPEPKTSLSEISASDGVQQGDPDVRVEVDPSSNEAKFYYSDQTGQKKYFDPMYEGKLQAATTAKGVELSYEGVGVGLVTDGKLYLCNRFNLGGATLDFPCNANFYTPRAAPSELDSQQLGAKPYSVDLSLATLPSDHNKAARNARIDLSRYAQNQINQHGTATCAFNAATGIMEILYAMKTGSLVNFSEPYYLIKAPSSYGEDWFWTMYDRVDEETKGLAQDRQLPVTSVYKSTYGFDDARNAAARQLQESRASATKLPYTMNAEKLFWYGKWNNEPTDEDDYDRTVRWFMRHRMPVNVHHVINGYWHSVVMIGYDPATDRILIKDSLGNTHVKGTWKTKKWFVEYAYGAIGITSPQIDR